MFQIHKREVMWGGRKLTLETGRVARQADGAVLATYGETTVLATVVAAKSPREGVDFLPLTVDYQEKYYAAGRIPGGYFKREGRPTEKETLVSRLIDRPIRPLFVEGYQNETQVIATVLSHDLENDPDIVALVAASAALTLSGVPFMGPIGAARVGLIDGQLVLNPTLEQVKETKLDLVVAGTSEAVLMVESEAQELSEDEMLSAVMFGHRSMQPVIDAIISLAEAAAKPPRDHVVEDKSALLAKVIGLVDADLRAAYQIRKKSDRQAAVGAAKAKVLAEMACCISRWPNITAPSITSSPSSCASDSTIITASCVPATTRSSLEVFTASWIGFSTSWPSIRPTRAAPMGPMKGTPEMVRAAEAATSATTSGSFSRSWLRTVQMTCVSFW